ncbi:MAG: ATP-binding protein [Bilophila wadsworthia]
MYKIGDSTTQLYEYPYTVSRKAQEMKTALYGIRISLPSLLATPDITAAQINDLLRKQRAMQDKSLEEITLKFRGNEKELAYLKRCMAELREARKNMVNNLLGNLDFQYINAYYAREVLPHFEKVDKLLGNLGDAAEHRGNAILAEMDKLRTFSIIATLLMGISIILLILHTRKLEWDKYKESAYREKLLNLLAANIDEIFFISREDKSFEYVSSNSERVIGVPPEKFIHDYRKLYSLLACKDSDWLRAVLDDTSSNMKERDIVLGEEGRRFNIRVYPIFLNGVLSQRIIVLFDQTKEFAYRQALSDALENARNANTAKSNFLSHMSHEIRTPMNAIIGMTVIALTRLDDRSRMEDCLTKIALSSRHLLGLINDVLDMSKIEGGKLTIAHEPFDFKISLQGVINLIQPQALERGLDFEVSLSGVDEEELLGDALRLNQILINILSNALKFTPVGGSIRLEVHQLHKKNNNVQFRFVIRDTGIGMSQEFIKRLYTPFEQATSSTASKFGGTGLGMAITKNLVSLLGGTIFVKSEEAGPSLLLRLPFGLSGRQLEKANRARPLKVLVVMTTRYLRAPAALDKWASYRWVLSGAEAVKVVQESHVSGDDYDVCFIDWKMPDMDGMETVRRIRNEVGPETLIIIISAYDWGAIEEKARAIGVNGFIAKPFFASNLYNTLTSLTRRTAPKREIEVSATQESEAETAHQHYDFTGKHILLVEDNEFNREVAQEFLK